MIYLAKRLQVLDNLLVPVLHGHGSQHILQRLKAHPIRCMHICTLFHQQLHNLWMSHDGGQVQRRVAIGIPGIDRSAICNQRLDYGRISKASCNMQRCIASAIGSINVCTAFKENIDDTLDPF